MRVYRVCSEKELDIVFNGDTTKIGRVYDDSFRNVNSNRYVYDERYIHFFFSKSSAPYIANFYLENGKGKYYLCTYDIPVKLLARNVGRGYYDKLNQNEGSFLGIKYKRYVGKYSKTVRTSRIEFAINSNDFNPRWLINYKRIKSFVREKQNISDVEGGREA